MLEAVPPAWRSRVGAALARGRLAPLALTGAIVAAAAVASQIDPTRVGWAPRCPVKALTGLDCPGCGSGRGLHALASGDVLAAFDFNVLLPFAVLSLVVAYVAWAAPRLWPAAAWVQDLSRFDVLRRGRSAQVLLGAVTVFTVVRNLGFGPLRFLNSGIAF